MNETDKRVKELRAEVKRLDLDYATLTENHRQLQADFARLAREKEEAKANVLEMHRVNMGLIDSYDKIRAVLAHAVDCAEVSCYEQDSLFDDFAREWAKTKELEDQLDDSHAALALVVDALNEVAKLVEWQTTPEDIAVENKMKAALDAAKGVK